MSHGCQPKAGLFKCPDKRIDKLRLKILMLREPGETIGIIILLKFCTHALVYCYAIKENLRKRMD